MRRCENCTHARCLLGPAPHVPDLWVCKARGGEAQTRPVMRAMTCRAYESRYRLRVGDGGR